MTSRKNNKALGFGAAAVLAVVLATGAPATVSAQTMDAALARAYGGNPTLNAQRAAVRATNENVPQALSGYRPRITASADIGASIIDSETPAFAGGSLNLNGRSTSRLGPRGAGVQIDQNIFDSGKTRSSVSQAESQVLGARATLRNTEQNVLLDGATSYMNVLRDTAILNLNRNNVEVLEEQLRQTQDRFQVGEVTRTDVAQAEARLSSARSQVILAESNLKTSIARYRQNIGAEPRKLAPGRPVENLLPKALPAALEIALTGHPAIVAALHGVDAAELQVKVTEADLYPVVGVRGLVSQRYDTQIYGDQRTSASVVGTLTIPIYEGGQVYSRTPPGQGDGRAASHRGRHPARHGSRGGRFGLGRAGSGQGADHRGAGPGPGGRDRSRRRARGGQGRPAHDARRAQRPAGTRQRAFDASDRPARPRRRFLRRPVGDRAPLGGDVEAEGGTLRLPPPLRSGQGPALGHADARRALNRRLSGNTAQFCCGRAGVPPCLPAPA